MSNLLLIMIIIFIVNVTKIWSFNKLLTHIRLASNETDKDHDAAPQHCSQYLLT